VSPLLGRFLIVNPKNLPPMALLIQMEDTSTSITELREFLVFECHPHRLLVDEECSSPIKRLCEI